MKKSATWLFCIFLVGCADTTPKGQAETPGELQQAVTSGISLLESRQYEEFVRLMIPPHVLADYEEEGLSVRTIADGYEKVQGAQVLKVLKHVSALSPEISADGATATFNIPKRLDPNGKGLVHFVKIEEKWYAKE